MATPYADQIIAEWKKKIDERHEFLKGKCHTCHKPNPPLTDAAGNKWETPWCAECTKQWNHEAHINNAGHLPCVNMFEQADRLLAFLSEDLTPRRGGAMSEARLIQVIQTTSKEGNGTDRDPIRTVIEYWSVDGEFLAKRDMVLQNIKSKGVLDLICDLSKEKIYESRHSDGRPTSYWLSESIGADYVRRCRILLGMEELP